MREHRRVAPLSKAPPPPRGRFLRGYQLRTLLDLLDGIERHRGATFTVLFPRQAGKNEVAAALVDALLRSHAGQGGSIVVCAPAYRPQARISVERAAQLLASTDRVSPGAGHARLAGNTIEVGRARVTFLSAAPGAHVSGHTASLALIADEAQEIDAAWFDRQFRPMAATTGAPTVLFGTPWDGRTLLDEAVAANRERDRRGGDVHLHHQVGWTEVAASLPAYGDLCAARTAAAGVRPPPLPDAVRADRDGRVRAAPEAPASWR